MCTNSVIYIQALIPSKYCSFYLPSSPSHTEGGLRGQDGWLTKRQIRIATLRILKDDETKKEHKKPITRGDVIQALTDTNLWTHLLITFLG
jgi:hypothetical protein